MIAKTTVVLIGYLTLCSLFTSAVQADSDWQQGMFDAGNTRHNQDENVLGVSNVGRLELAWRVELPEGVLFKATPIVADGRIFIGTIREPFVNDYRGEMLAFDAETGELLWRGPEQSSHFDGSAAYADGLVLAAAASGRLRAYDAETGGVVWTAEPWGLDAPTLAGGMVFAVGTAAGELYAIDPRSGEILWRRLPPGFGSSEVVAVDDGRVFLLRNGELTAVDATTGLRLWTVGGITLFPSTPAAANGKVYYGGASVIFAHDQATGAELWFAPVYTGSTDASPAIANGVVFSQEEDMLAAVDDDTGDVLWQVPAEGELSLGPSIANGVVYTTDRNGNLKAFEAATGSLLWSNPPDACSGVCKATIPVVANETLFLAGPGSSLRAYRLAGLDLSIAGLNR